MDEILAEEFEIERKIKALKGKSKTNYKINLRSIKTPEDIGVIVEREREAALRRNADFLQELETQAAKLHTKRLCPMQKKLDELKATAGLVSSGFPRRPFLSEQNMKDRERREKTGHGDCGDDTMESLG